MRFDTEFGPLDPHLARLVVAGWTGRDEAAVRHHIEELAAIGVAPPSKIPLLYAAASTLLTNAAVIEVLGAETSGEAEPLVIRSRGAIWLGLASDHTDRGLEAHSVAHSKQICAKPAASTLWTMESVGAFDDIELRSWIDEGAGWTLYQDGTLASIRPLADLIARADLRDDEAMLCGTLPAIGGVRPAARFRMALRDPARGREITHEYSIRTLPVIA